MTVALDTAPRDPAARLPTERRTSLNITAALDAKFPDGRPHPPDQDRHPGSRTGFLLRRRHAIARLDARLRTGRASRRHRP